MQLDITIGHRYLLHIGLLRASNDSIKYKSENTNQT